MDVVKQPEVPELSDVDMAFPAGALSWMPAWEDIPEEFKERDNEWTCIASSWFGNGLPADVKFYPREGVDAEKAYKAVGATLGSYAPKHEHKMAATAFMLSSWFAKIEDWKQKEKK